METMLTNFIDDKFLRHYNEEMKQVVIKSVDDYRKLTSTYPIVIRVDIKNIENTIGVDSFNFGSSSNSDDEEKRVNGTISIYAKFGKDGFIPSVVIKSIADLLDSFVVDIYGNMSYRDKNILILVDNRSGVLSYSDVVSLYAESFVTGEFQVYENLDFMVACNDDIKKVENIFLEKKKEKKEKKKSKKNKKK